MKKMKFIPSSNQQDELHKIRFYCTMLCSARLCHGRTVMP